MKSILAFIAGYVCIGHAFASDAEAVSGAGGSSSAVGSVGREEFEGLEIPEVDDAKRDLGKKKAGSTTAWYGASPTYAHSYPAYPTYWQQAPLGWRYLGEEDASRATEMTAENMKERLLKKKAASIGSAYYASYPTYWRQAPLGWRYLGEEADAPLEMEIPADGVEERLLKKKAAPIASSYGTGFYGPTWAAYPSYSSYPSYFSNNYYPSFSRRVLPYRYLSKAKKTTEVEAPELSEQPVEAGVGKRALGEFDHHMGHHHHHMGHHHGYGGFGNGGGYGMPYGGGYGMPYGGGYGMPYGGGYGTPYGNMYGGGFGSPIGNVIGTISRFLEEDVHEPSVA